MADYIPRNDTKFTFWQGNMIEIVGLNLVNWGIHPADFMALIEKQSSWTNAYVKASNKQERTMTDVQDKDDMRATFKKEIRIFVAQWLSYNAKVPNSDRERMGLTVRSGTFTPVPVPATFPTGTVEFSLRLQHSLHYHDEASSPSKAKPYGVHGCEIWRKIDGAAPADASELTYLSTKTRSPYRTEFDEKYAGKMIYYWLRWVNTKEEPGPWSNTISAMVPG